MPPHGRAICGVAATWTWLLAGPAHALPRDLGPPPSASPDPGVLEETPEPPVNQRGHEGTWGRRTRWPHLVPERGQEKRLRTEVSRCEVRPGGHRPCSQHGPVPSRLLPSLPRPPASALRPQTHAPASPELGQSTRSHVPVPADL
uniref:Uncharacterized protein n=1 Tax=Myotis myotis TaxID=51298 RepID=A0A7J7SRM3_MYOMY|nr:hypothetical protein mMyoMyo1_009431 [Myotis myotis]